MTVLSTVGGLDAHNDEHTHNDELEASTPALGERICKPQARPIDASSM
jgi:hypothetical protein